MGYEAKVTKDGKNAVIDEDAQKPMVDYYKTHEECKEQCVARCGMWGAWSYNTLDGACYFHTSEACCGQKIQGREESTTGYVSGYTCTKCWSTEDPDCHCSVEERRKGQLGCAGIAQSNNGAGTGTQYISPTGQVGIHEIGNWKRDPCRPIRRTIFGTRRWIKKPCKDEELNPCGRCEDVRRCRIPTRKNLRCPKFKN